jgi:UDP-2,3-diacylglucosamine pyrophosphatase LpxH
MTPTYRSIFISDVHLGSKACKARLLNSFLKHNSCHTLYLVGDIIDGWKVQQNRFSWSKHQSNVVKRIIKLSTEGTKVIYVVGNHDEFLRPMLSHRLVLHGLELHNQHVHTAVDGRRYLVTHGDLFDGITRVGKWLSILGDRAYDLVLWLNNYFNAARHRLGFGYWSLSQFLKHRV